MKAMIVNTLTRPCCAGGGALSRHPNAASMLGQVVEIVGPTTSGCLCCVSIDMYVNVGGYSNGLPMGVNRENLMPIDDPPDEEVSRDTERKRERVAHREDAT